MVETDRELSEALFALHGPSANARQRTAGLEDFCCKGVVGAKFMDDSAEQAVLHTAPWHGIGSMQPSLHNAGHRCQVHAYRERLSAAIVICKMLNSYH